jgi:hypothetical protein
VALPPLPRWASKRAGHAAVLGIGERVLLVVPPPLPLRAAGRATACYVAPPRADHGRKMNSRGLANEELEDYFQNSPS